MITSDADILLASFVSATTFNCAVILFRVGRRHLRYASEGFNPVYEQGRSANSTLQALHCRAELFFPFIGFWNSAELEESESRELTMIKLLYGDGEAQVRSEKLGLLPAHTDMV